MSKISKKLLLGFSFWILAVLFSGCSMSDEEKAQLSLTVEAANLLTSNYGDEVSQIIVDYHMETGSLEAHQSPEIVKDWFTTQTLGFRLSQTELADEPYWIIVKSVKIDHIRIVEHRSDEIKAISCRTVVHEEFEPNGRFLETYPAVMLCGVYVFVKEENVWKIAAYFDTTHPDNVARDWEYTSSWTKEVIGELPHDPSMIRERTGH